MPKQIPKTSLLSNISRCKRKMWTTKCNVFMYQSGKLKKKKRKQKENVIFKLRPCETALCEEGLVRMYFSPSNPQCVG